MNAIVPSNIGALSFGEVERLAHSIAKSGLFGMKTPEQALALMMISHAEGRHPALAARDFDIIQNRPAKKAEAMLRDFLEAGGRVEWHALTDETADATFSHPQGGTVRITWDMKRAMAAGLGGKDMWKKFPRQMLRSRAVSEGVRTVWPGATSGLYCQEEARDFTGTTIEATAEPILTTAQAIQDDLPSEADQPYPFMTPNGGSRYATAAQWQDRWEKLIRDCQRIDGGLDKLQRAREMNAPAFADVGQFDAKAVAVVRMALDTALAPTTDWPADADAANEPEQASAA